MTNRNLFNTHQRGKAVMIESLRLPPRIISILKDNKMPTLSQLSAVTKQELLAIPGIGTKSAQIIIEHVEQFIARENERQSAAR